MPRPSRSSSRTRRRRRGLLPGLADGVHAHPGTRLAAPDARRRRDGVVHPDAAPDGRLGADRAIAIAEGTRLFTLAESLGGVESLIEVPAAMTHRPVVGSPLEVDPALIRLSVGIEEVDDLIADLRQALDGS